MLEFIKVELLKDLDIIDETLSRMGIANLEKKILYPTCYIYNLNEQYHLMHFKEIFHVRYGESNMNEEDYLRRDSIAYLLENWGLINILNMPEEIDTIYVHCISHKERKDWKIKNKIKVEEL